MKVNDTMNGLRASVLFCVVLLCFALTMRAASAGEDEKLYNQGSVFCMQGQWDRAIECFSKVVTQYPSAPFAEPSYFWLGYSRQQSGDYSQAVQTLKAFAAKYPQSKYAPEALYKVGEIYDKNLNSNQKAIAAYSEVENRYPSSQQAIKSLLNKAKNQELKANDFYGAQQSYSRAITLANENKSVYQGDKEKAQERLNFIQRHSDNDYKPLTLYTQAVTAEESGNIDRAIEGYRAIVNSYRRSSLVDDAAFRKIKCWERKGVIMKVKEESRSFLSNFPKSSYIPQVKSLLRSYR